MIATWLPVICSVVIAIAAVIAVFMTVKSQKSEHLKWMGSVDAKLSQFEISIQDIKNDIRSLTSNIFDISYRMGSKVADKQSPVRLTDFGQEISKNLDAPNWVKKISDVVQHEVKGMEPYDIQEFSFQYVQDDTHYSDENRRLIRDIAYEQGISEFEVRQVLGIELMDRLLNIEDKEAPRLVGKL